MPHLPTSLFQSPEFITWVVVAGSVIGIFVGSIVKNFNRTVHNIEQAQRDVPSDAKVLNALPAPQAEILDHFAVLRKCLETLILINNNISLITRTIDRQQDLLEDIRNGQSDFDVRVNQIRSLEQERNELLQKILVCLQTMLKRQLQ